MREHWVIYFMRRRGLEPSRREACEAETASGGRTNEIFYNGEFVEPEIKYP